MAEDYYPSSSGAGASLEPGAAIDGADASLEAAAAVDATVATTATALERILGGVAGSKASPIALMLLGSTKKFGEDALAAQNDAVKAAEADIAASEKKQQDAAILILSAKVKTMFEVKSLTKLFGHPNAAVGMAARSWVDEEARIERRRRLIEAKAPVIAELEAYVDKPPRGMFKMSARGDGATFHLDTARYQHLKSKRGAKFPDEEQDALVFGIIMEKEDPSGKRKRPDDDNISHYVSFSVSESSSAASGGAGAGAGSDREADGAVGRVTRSAKAAGGK